MIVKVTEFIWNDIRIRKEVKSCFAKLVLHASDVYRQFVLACDFLARWKVVDLLVLV